MTSRMDYLDSFEELEYQVQYEYVALWNLKAMGGMEVAELLTYLFDDGYDGLGDMFSNERNGYLMVYRRQEVANNRQESDDRRE